MPDDNVQLYHASSFYYLRIARYAIELSGLTYESHLLDIHQKREQLRPWCVAINPAMTVPALMASVFTDWLKQKAQAREFLRAGVWVKFDMWRLLTHS